MKTAIILFNLGGPDSIESVQPFLFNLFYDPAIITVKNPLRWLIAKLISSRRAKTAQEIYRQIGGRSPILPNTEQQAAALQKKLGPDFKCFIVMRYWHPRADEQIKAVKAWNPDKIILLPLYPQFSTTTTGSSIAEWKRIAKKEQLNIKTQEICCYPNNAGFIKAVSDKVVQSILNFDKTLKKPRLLFSAHGLPKKIVTSGDPYQSQVEETVEAIIKSTGMQDLDYQICYQSRVGPLEWIGPSTEAEIERAAHDKVPVIVVPVAFVSEHSETLVELDIEYRELAEKLKIPAYLRLPTVDCDEPFIDGLCEIIHSTMRSEEEICPFNTNQKCAKNHARCPFQERK